MLARLQRRRWPGWRCRCCWRWPRRGTRPCARRRAGWHCACVGYTLVLALEFVLLAVVHGDDPTPRAGVLTAAARLVGRGVSSRRGVLLAPAVPRACAGRTSCRARWAVRGVVFVHGFVCNRGFWNPWLRRCARRACPVVAVNLEPVFGAIDDLRAHRRAVRRAARASDRPAAADRGAQHGRSGGARMAGRHARRRRPRASPVTIGSPHGGTWLARWAIRSTRTRCAQPMAGCTVSRRSEPARALRELHLLLQPLRQHRLPAAPPRCPAPTTAICPATPHVAMAIPPRGHGRSAALAARAGAARLIAAGLPHAAPPRWHRRRARVGAPRAQ